MPAVLPIGPLVCVVGDPEAFTKRRSVKELIDPHLHNWLDMA
jgi:hypothetical protein